MGAGRPAAPADRAAGRDRVSARRRCFAGGEKCGRREARRGARGSRPRRGEAGRRRAGALPRRRGEPRAVGRRVRGLGGRRMRRRGSSSSASAARRARSPWLAFATSRASAGAMRSSCSSGSTRTASRGGSVTAGCCDGPGGRTEPAGYSAAAVSVAMPTGTASIRLSRSSCPVIRAHQGRIIQPFSFSHLEVLLLGEAAEAAFL